MTEKDPIQAMQNKFKFYGRVIILIIMILLAVPYFTNKTHFGILDYVNLPFHEAGHFVFGLFGEFIGILGGMLGQFFVPTAFLVYFFFFKKDSLGVLFSLFWFFENFVNVSVYMADAQSQILPYIGGEVHDWAYLFAETKLITKSFAIAGFFRITGLLGMAASIAALGYETFFKGLRINR